MRPCLSGVGVLVGSCDFVLCWACEARGSRVQTICQQKVFLATIQPHEIYKVVNVLGPIIICDILLLSVCYHQAGFLPLALRGEKCFTVRCRASSMETIGMYPSSWRALLQSSWRFALAMRMRMGVNSEAAMLCTETTLL